MKLQEEYIWKKETLRMSVESPSRSLASVMKDDEMCVRSPRYVAAEIHSVLGRSQKDGSVQKKKKKVLDVSKFRSLRTF